MMRDMRLHMRIGQLEGELEAIRKHIGLSSNEDNEEEEDEENVGDDSDEADDEDE
jgi:hypothetical protein